MNLFLATYWKQISFAVAGLILLAYIALLKYENNALERDNASLNATIATISAQGKLQNDKADRIEQGSRKAAQIITDQYTSDLEKVKDYYAKNPVVKFKPNGVCNIPTDNRTKQVPTTDASSERVDERAANPVSTGASIEEQCAVTTLMLLKLQEFETKQQEVQ